MLANKVRPKNCELLRHKSQNPHKEKLIQDTHLRTSEGDSDDARQDTSSECHGKDDVDKEERGVEIDPIPKLSIMERVLTEKFQGTKVLKNNCQTSSQICPEDFEHCSSTLSQAVRQEDLSTMSGNTRSSFSSACISVDRYDDLGRSMHSGSEDTMYGDDCAGSDGDMEITPSGILEALRHLMGLEGNDQLGDFISIGSEESRSWMSDESESDHDDDEDIMMNSQSRNSNFASTTHSLSTNSRSSASGVKDVEDQQVRQNQNNLDVNAETRSLHLLVESPNLANACADFPTSHMTRSESATTSRDFKEGKSSHKLHVTPEKRWAPVFFKRMRSDEASSAGIEIPITELTKLKAMTQDCQQHATVSNDHMASTMGNSSAAHGGVSKTATMAHTPGHPTDSKGATSSTGTEVIFKSPNPQTVARKSRTGIVGSVAGTPNALTRAQDRRDEFDSDEMTSEGMEVAFAKLRHAGIPKVLKMAQKPIHGFDSDEVTSEGMEVPLAKLIHAEIPKVLKIVQKPGRVCDSDEATSEGMEVPLPKLRHGGIPKALKLVPKPGVGFDSDEVTSEGMEVPLRHSGIPRAAKLVQKPGHRLDSDEVTSEGMEVPFAKLYQAPHTSSRKSIIPLDSEEVSSAGVEIDIGLCPTPLPIRNQTSEERPIFNQGVTKENTEGAPLSQTRSLMDPLRVDFFCGWIHSGSTCVHCKEAFSWMDSRTECHVAGVEGEVHTACKADYEQLRKKYNKVVNQVALFGLIRKKRARELKARQIRRKQEGTGTSRRNSGFWAHLKGDTKGREQQRRSRIRNRRRRPMAPPGQQTLPRPRSTRITTIPEDAPLRPARRASLVSPPKATQTSAFKNSQRSRAFVTASKGNPSTRGVIVTPASKTRAQKQKQLIVPTCHQSRPSSLVGTLPAANRMNSHRLVRDLDDVVVCPRGYTLA